MTIISFSGCDGSGKTTIAKIVCEKLGLIQKCEYREEFKYFILRYLLKIFSNVISKERDKFLSGARNVTKFDRIKYKIWCLLVWADSNIEQFILRLLKRHVNVLDRCLFDHLLSFYYLGYIDSGAVKFLTRLSLKPHVRVLLDARPEILYARKRATHNYDISFYVKQRSNYLILGKQWYNCIVNTEQGLRDTLYDTFQCIYLRRADAIDVILLIISDPFIDDEIAYNLLKSLNSKNIISDHVSKIAMLVSTHNVETVAYRRLCRFFGGIFCKLYRFVKVKLEATSVVLSELTETCKQYGVKYMVFKTIPYFETLPHDIDVLIYPSERTNDIIRALKERGYKLIKTHLIHPEVSLEKFGTEIDLHWDITWMGVKPFKVDELVLRSKEVNALNGIKVTVPSTQDEFLIVISHIILQHGYTTLGDIHFLRSLLYIHDNPFELLQHGLRFFESKGLTHCYISVLKVLYAKEHMLATLKREQDSKILKPLEQILKRYPDYGISLEEAIKSVSWLRCKIAIRNLLNMLSYILNIYRRFIYMRKETTLLPYNVPVKPFVSK